MKVFLLSIFIICHFDVLVTDVNYSYYQGEFRIQDRLAYDVLKLCKVKLGYVLVFKCSIIIIGHKNCLNNISWQELECSNCNCLS